MIDFACKNFKIEDIVKCSLGLSKADFFILNFFIKQKDREFSTLDISKYTGFELSTVQRASKKLHEKNILIRSQKNLDNGGYVYFYKLKSKKEIREIIMKIISNWTKKVENELERWG